MRHRLVVLRLHDASLAAGLDLQAASYCLVVLVFHDASLHIRFDLQAMGHRLVVLHIYSASFDVRFDFHRVFPFLENSKLIVRPRLALSLDGFGLFRGAADDDIPIAGPCFHIRLDFHVFLSLKIGVDC